MQTDRYKLLTQVKRQVFGRYRNKYTNEAEAADTNMGTANTTAMFHAGRLYALKESDLPYEIDPDTLETIGATDMAGQIGSISFTAHPKVDPVTNELLGFAYQAKGDATRDIVYYLFSGDGRKKHEIWFEMPYAACVHDFAITDDWVVFPFFPLITDIDVIKAGGPFYQWDPAQETVIALVPRYGTDASEIRWFRGPATSAGHMMNAVREGTQVHLDLCLYEGNCFPLLPHAARRTHRAGAALPHAHHPRSRAQRRRLRESAAAGPKLRNAAHRRPLSGRAYRHGYMIVYRAADGSSATGHLDFATGELETYSPGPGDTVQECQFVPRTPRQRGRRRLAARARGASVQGAQRPRHSRRAKSCRRPGRDDQAAGARALDLSRCWVPAETLKSGRYDYALVKP